MINAKAIAQEIKRACKERDEARRLQKIAEDSEAEGTRILHKAQNIMVEQGKELHEARAQVAALRVALRVALNTIADHAPWGGPDVRDYIKWMQGVARNVLTDTEEAAAPTSRPQAGEGETG